MVAWSEVIQECSNVLKGYIKFKDSLLQGLKFHFSSCDVHFIWTREGLSTTIFFCKQTFKMTATSTIQPVSHKAQPHNYLLINKRLLTTEILLLIPNHFNSHSSNKLLLYSDGFIKALSLCQVSCSSFHAICVGCIYILSEIISLTMAATLWVVLNTKLV